MRHESVDWDFIYCLIIDRTGWSWEYVDDHMDIPRLLKMNQYWRAHPPLREMVQAYLGIEIKTDDSGQEAGQDLDGLIALFGGIGGSL